MTRSFRSIAAAIAVAASLSSSAIPASPASAQTPNFISLAAPLGAASPITGVPSTAGSQLLDVSLFGGAPLSLKSSSAKTAKKSKPVKKSSKKAKKKNKKKSKKVLAKKTRKRHNKKTTKKTPASGGSTPVAPPTPPTSPPTPPGGTEPTPPSGGGSSEGSKTPPKEEVVAAPVNTTPPAITAPSGSPKVGETLTSKPGVWEGAPTKYAYQWEDCNTSGKECHNASNGTGSTFTLGTGDTGHKLLLIVKATNAGGSTTATSNQTATVAAATKAPPPAAPTNTTLPSVSGTTTEGQTLTAGTGAWSGSPTGYTYQWEDCNSSGASCTNISGATSSTHGLTSTDVGHTLRVAVNATNNGGSTTATSNQTATVAAATKAPPPAAPTNTTLPSVSGTTTEGQTLTAGTGAWSGSPTGYTYQWEDCSSTGASCTNISGATTSTHKLTATDVAHTVRVAVKATNSGGSTTATSNQTATVAAATKAPSNPTCTTTISSGLESAISNAAAGSTICLNAGNYGSIGVNTKKASMVTITTASGVSASQAVLGYTEVEGSSNLTFKNLTIQGASNSSATTATHIHWISDAFTSGVCVHAPTSTNLDILIEGSTFINIASGGCGNEGRLEIDGDNEGPSGTNGVVISHDVFKTASPSGCTDGVNITGGASGTQIGPGDEFANMKQGSCSAHVDPIQFYGASNTTVTGDYFHGNSDGIMSPDGNGSPMTVTNSVFDTDGEYPDQIVIGGGNHDTISHDTFGNGADVRIGHVNVGATANNETITNNILTGGIRLTEEQSTSGWTIDYNLIPGGGGGTHGVSGNPSYVGGGSEPSTWAGWALTSSSLGHLAASDGTSIGSTYFGP